MQYDGTSVSEMEKGPVLMCFKEPAQTKGGRASHRSHRSNTPTSAGLQRCCVPYSQIERVLAYCHTGGPGKTMHHGQKSM